MQHLKKMLVHPLIIIILFCGLIISGEQIGGVYLFYILLGLPHFALHSVLGSLSIICLLFTYYNKARTTAYLRLLGAMFMLTSLLYFFTQKNADYNYNTFHEVLPLSILIVFTIFISLFIFSNILVIAQPLVKKESRTV